MMVIAFEVGSDKPMKVSLRIDWNRVISEAIPAVNICLMSNSDNHFDLQIAYQKPVLPLTSRRRLSIAVAVTLASKMFRRIRIYLPVLCEESVPITFYRLYRLPRIVKALRFVKLNKG